MEIIVTVHRPVLTPEERARRMAQIKEAATNLVVAAMKVRRQTARPASLSPQ